MKNHFDITDLANYALQSKFSTEQPRIQRKIAYQQGADQRHEEGRMRDKYPAWKNEGLKSETDLLRNDLNRAVNQLLTKYLPNLPILNQHNATSDPQVDNIRTKIPTFWDKYNKNVDLINEELRAVYSSLGNSRHATSMLEADQKFFAFERNHAEFMSSFSNRITEMCMVMEQHLKSYITFKDVPALDKSEPQQGMPILESENSLPSANMPAQLQQGLEQLARQDREMGKEQVEKDITRIKYDDLVKNNQNLVKNNQDLVEKYEDVKDENTTLKIRCATAEQKAESSTRENEELKQDKQELRQDKSNLQKQVIKLEEGTIAKDLKIDEKDLKIEELQKQLSEVLNKYSVLQQEHNDLLASHQVAIPAGVADSASNYTVIDLDITGDIPEHPDHTS